MISRRLLIKYFFMVGLPLILLLVVLRLGRTLKAPPELQGTWDVALSGAAPATCDPALHHADGFLMLVSQSGSYLTATTFHSGERVLRGRSEGSNLWFESAEINDPSPDGDLLRLTGTLSNTEDGGKLIRGTVLMPRRVDCPPVGFEARLQSADDPQAGYTER